MVKAEIIVLLDKKMIEHQKEIDGAQRDLLDERGKLKAKSVPEAAKTLILKDKILFHKAAILTLQDIKNELNNG